MARNPSQPPPHTPPAGPPPLSPHAAHLYQRIYRRLHAGLGSCGTEAEDATQDAFLEALKNRARIRQGVPEYVSGVARMKLREHYRRRARYARTTSLADLDALPSAAPDASAVVERVLEVGLLVEALQQLRLEDQRCLALVYGRELRNVEAAAVLGLGKVDFDNRLGRARTRLRKVLEESDALGLARRCSLQSFQHWVVAVLGPAGHEANRASVSPFGNRCL